MGRVIRPTKGKGATKAMRVTKVKKHSVGPKRLNKNTIRSALVAGLKSQSGRKDIKFDKSPEVASRAMLGVCVEINNVKLSIKMTCLGHLNEHPNIQDI